MPSQLDGLLPEDGLIHPFIHFLLYLNICLGTLHIMANDTEKLPASECEQVSSQAGQGGHPQGTASIREGGPEMGWENGSQPTTSSCNSSELLSPPETW